MSCINEEICLQILKICSKENIQFVSYKINPYSDETLGFLGEHSKLQIIGKNKVLNFFVKSLPTGIKGQIDYIKKSGIFKKEALLYKELIHKLQFLVEVKFAPKFVLTDVNSFIILEDLSLGGFVANEDKTQILDFAHCKCLLESLANFHASSIIFEELNNCRLNDRYKDMLYETTFSFEKGHPREDWSRTTIKTLIDISKKIPKYQNLDCATNLRKLLSDMQYYISPSNKYRNVINHDDLWLNNFMFNYNKSNPKHCVFVDFQMSRYVPPCSDFLCFLYLTTTKTFHQSHFQELVDIYFNAFSQQLQRHNLSVNEILSKETFLESCQEFKSAALLEATMFGTIVYLSNEFSIEITSDSDKYIDFMQYNRPKYVNYLFEQDKVYRKRLEHLLDQLLECIM